MSGVRKISMYAATTGLAITHAMMPIATTASTAYLILMPTSAPTARGAISRTASSRQRRRNEVIARTLSGAARAPKGR